MLKNEESKEDYTEIGYTPISGGTILPFVIELDRKNSNLYPQPNENQRFCYTVTGIGTENPQFADLSDLVLEICDQILQDEIVNIAVTIDGVEQDVSFKEGGRIQLTTRQNSDGISEYPGLKFNTNLNKVHGKMHFSFELTCPYPIGRNKVYLVGSNADFNVAGTYGPVRHEPQDSSVNAYQNASVYIPVEVIPRADSGEIKTSCFGEPTVTFREDRTGSKYCFTIIQPICVEVPLEFRAEALLGNIHIKSGEETDTGFKPVCEGICEDSSSEQEPLQQSQPKNYYKVIF